MAVSNIRDGMSKIQLEEERKMLPSNGASLIPGRAGAPKDKKDKKVDCCFFVA
jgi:hypothetical protein